MSSGPAACAVTPRLCTITNLGIGSFNGAFPTSAYGDPNDPLKLTGDSAYIREENRGFYGEADFTTTLGGMPVDGNLGVRAVGIKESGIGISSVAYYLTTAVFDPSRPSVNILVTDDASYWRVLPTFNVTVHPSKNLNLRLGIGKTMSMPEYSLLRPSSNVRVYDSGARGQASAGNLHVKPTLSWNYDVTSEYYFSNGGAVITSLFYKKVSDFANTETVVGTQIPGQSGLFDVTEAINSQSGHAQGFEIGTNQPFTFLPAPWDGFGLQGNFTFVDSKFDAAANDASAPKGNFPGASKYNANATAYFEKYGLGIRAAYTYRSRYVYQLGTDGTSLLANPQGKLDTSVSYKFNKFAEIFFTATNLTGEHQALRYERANAFAGYSERPRVYSIAVRLAL